MWFKKKRREGVRKVRGAIPREAPPKAWPPGKPPGGKLPPGAIVRPEDADAPVG